MYDQIVDTFLLGRDQALRQRLLQGVEGNPSRILDVGIGTGRNLPLLARVNSGAEVVGVDISPGMLERAESRVVPGTNVTLICNDILDADLKPGFDLIVCTYVFSVAVKPHCLADRLRKLASDKAKLLILDAHYPNRSNPLFSTLLKFEEWIAAADLSLNFEKLMPSTTVHRSRQFEFWKYIKGLEYRVSHSLAQ